LDGLEIRESDLVEKVDKGYRVTRRISRKQGDAVLPNLVKHPKNVILAIHDPNAIVPNVAQVTVDQLKNLFAVGLKGLGKDKPTFAQACAESENFAPFANATQLSDKLQSLLQASGAKLFVINSANEAKDVANVIKAVNSGSKFQVNDKKKTKLWTSLSHDQVRDREWKDEGRYNDSITQLEKRVEEQISKLPKVTAPAK
jgi:ATP-dependent phosphoenolpyruvate carboxykinase